MNNIVKKVEHTSNMIILQFVNQNPLTLMKLGFCGDEQFIRIIKYDEQNICTIWKKDGSNISFDWGFHGHTCLSNLMEMQRQNIVKCVKQFGFKC